MMQDDIDALMAPERTGSGVLDLTEAMTASATPPPAPAHSEGFRTIDGQSDIVFEEGPEEPPQAPPPPEPRRHAQEMSDHRPLVSNSTSAAVDSAFNSLAQTVLVHNAQTLEDLVREMLRPLLKTWLDDNLPGLVERLVRAEIERVSRGRK
jgi:cell pole-organizing protein PopZ